MERDKEQEYIKLAQDHPAMLWKEIPRDLLEAISFSGDEPTEFLTNFFATGHTGWLSDKYRPMTRFPTDRIQRAVLLLWERGCRLHTSQLLNRPDPDWEKPLFSDEDLY